MGELLPSPAGHERADAANGLGLHPLYVNEYPTTARLMSRKSYYAYPMSDFELDGRMYSSAEDNYLRWSVLSYDGAHRRFIDGRVTLDHDIADYMEW